MKTPKIKAYIKNFGNNIFLSSFSDSVVRGDKDEASKKIALLRSRLYVDLLSKFCDIKSGASVSDTLR